MAFHTAYDSVIPLGSLLCTESFPGLFIHLLPSANFPQPYIAAEALVMGGDAFLKFLKTSFALSRDLLEEGLFTALVVSSD